MESPSWTTNDKYNAVLKIAYVHTAQSSVCSEVNPTSLAGFTPDRGMSGCAFRILMEVYPDPLVPYKVSFNITHAVPACSLTASKETIMKLGKIASSELGKKPSSPLTTSFCPLPSITHLFGTANWLVKIPWTACRRACLIKHHVHRDVLPYVFRSVASHDLSFALIRLYPC